MKVLDMTRGRSTYDIELTYSVLFECALGIAAITYPAIQSTLDKPVTFWEITLTSLSTQLQQELLLCQRHNTWKTLLQLLHQQPFVSVDSFVSYILTLTDQQLRYHSLPYIGPAFEIIRQKASIGDQDAIDIMVAQCKDHKFLAEYIPYITQVDASELRSHLSNLMKGWYDEFISPQASVLQEMLTRDYKQKLRMMNAMSSEEFVTWATGGFVYPPEPTVTKVLLIPHFIYRPWTIQAELEGIKILYYPMADENLTTHDDPYFPPSALVQRYKALGDETRLRLVKLLHEKDRTLQELTERLDIAKSTVHHHLTMLKSAYIVEAKDKVYRLNRTSLTLMDRELSHFLDKLSDV